MKLLTLIIVVYTTTFAAPAYHALRNFTNSDGSTFKAKAFGNQHLNWLESEDGEILKFNEETNNFEYATIQNKALKASGTKYEKNNSKRARAFKHINKIQKEELTELWKYKQALSHPKKLH